MEPKYSILYFKEDLSHEYTNIKRYLNEGIKVFWFGNSDEVNRIKNDFKGFADAFFLQAFTVTNIDGVNQLKSFIAIDGRYKGNDDSITKAFSWLEDNVYAFNIAQYRVEHCKEDANIVVKASAGTGKTTVMIDRILYLMHTVDGLDMSQIYMITFTNEATKQMNDRLQEIILKKYSLTKNKKYLTWLEQQSQMHVSTIDSLAYDLFKTYGTSVGFGRDLEIQPLEKERKDLFKDLISHELSDEKPITSQIGMTYFDASKLIDDYWKTLKMEGYTISEILSKNWTDDKTDALALNFQKVAKKVLEQFESQYSQLKFDENAISINDLFFDFGHFLLEGKLDCDGLDMKYLFVDEFQDTDATQIKTFASLTKTIGARLFVVGDIKQSIYMFKGATDKAFDILAEEMGGGLRYFSLRNNYRTSANIMTSMEEYFFKWHQEGLLTYEESVRPFNTNRGKIHMEWLNSKEYQDEQMLNVIHSELYDLEMDIKSGKKKVTDRSKVAVIVRGNKKAAELAQLCREDDITVVLSSDRPFFLSQAVRDFYALISSYIFANKPIYLFNFLNTPYARYKGQISITELEKCEGNERDVNEYLGNYLSQTNWHKYQREFRLHPVVSVISKIIKDENVIENFIGLDKATMNSSDMTPAKINKQALIDARNYQANLDKLMDMIQQRMNGEFTTLYDLYVYLTLMIATNREEMEPDVDMQDDYTSAYIMTAHKSKGLEFDTVVLPYMNNGLESSKRTQILVEDDKVGWFYERGYGGAMQNACYDDLRRIAVQKGVAEETRLLYVAMTRAVDKLVMIVNNWTGYESWSSLIRKVGLKNEK